MEQTDFYDRQKRLEADREIRKIIESGEAPVVDLSIFDCLDSLTVKDSIKGKIEFTIEEYQELLNLVKELPPILRTKYLLASKNADIIDNQVLEEEDSFLISLQREIGFVSALDETIEHYGKPYDKDTFVRIHDLLLESTSTEDEVGLREDNVKFVGTWEDGERKIQYFPIISDDVEEALRIFLSFYNANINNVHNEYDAILKPIIYHGLLSALQLFQDGNTRYARTIQHVEMWGMLNNIVDDDIDLPLLYATRQYFPYRGRYRELIKNIAIDNDEEAWDEWFRFNISRIQDSIYKSDTNIKTLQRKYR